ncbi:hypothetical protein CLOM_g22369 [Closterium sp. NIES-68]|nr:hypothetical protein CLOM_g22369 [Closterium sp. NIES-68]GJP73223.1 hypothetical protein CLOP_g3962 [Closterium sp. NIES-67]
MAALAPTSSLCHSIVSSTDAKFPSSVRANARLAARQPSTILPALSASPHLSSSASLNLSSRLIPTRPFHHGRQSTHSRVAVISAAAASDTPKVSPSSPSSSSKPLERVLVVGASGGVGQLCVASLLSKSLPVRALVRSVEKAEALFADAPADLIQIVSADLRQPGTISPALFTGVSAVIVCVGTTAFPSKRWDGDNGPEQTDYIGVKNLLAALPSTLSRIIFVSSAGVERYNQLPYNILNLFGVLKYKKMAEDLVKSSGIPYTILRPGRLTDGPYTSYDLNTLLKATAGMRKAVEVRRGSDTLSGETSRVTLAECCVQALGVKEAENEVFELLSVEGEGPGSDEGAWEKILASAPAGK